MIKKIIFDVDGTLLNTEKDCLDTYLEYFHNEEIATSLYDIIDCYDKENRSYLKEDLVEYINQRIGFNFTMDDFNNIFEIYNRHATLISEDIPEILKDLSKDYELVTLSKWYQDNQLKRLENALISNYFKNIYGFENAGIKPDKSSYLIASNNYDLNECLVVGDSIENDVKIPIEMGMQALYYNPSNKDSEYESISNLKEIKDKLERGKRL